MNLPENPNKDLIPFFNQREFVEATVAQINKDLQGLFFGDFQVDFTRSENLLHDLITNLIPILKELSKSQPEQLSQFIYKVDLNETTFMASFSKDPGLNDLAYLIIEREAQKVYLRSRFS